MGWFFLLALAYNALLLKPLFSEFLTITLNLQAILLIRWFVYGLILNGSLTFKRLLISATFSCPAAISHRVKYRVSSGML